MRRLAGIRASPGRCRSTIHLRIARRREYIGKQSEGSPPPTGPNTASTDVLLSAQNTHQPVQLSRGGQTKQPAAGQQGQRGRTSKILQRFQRGRALAANHVIVIERRNQARACTAQQRVDGSQAMRSGDPPLATASPDSFSASWRVAVKAQKNNDIDNRIE